jgi:signal transduction histidine kinase
MQSIDYLEDDAAFADKNAQEVFDIMKSNLKRADKTVRTLVDFSKLRKLKKVSSPINAVLDNSIILTQHAFKKANIKIVKEMGEGLPDVYIDKSKMEQVLVNIFLNAIQAMPEGGTIYVRTRTENLEGISYRVGRRKGEDYFSPGERVVIIEIEDTGKGISPSEQKKIFDPFFTTKGAEGTGLGLAVTRNIIELHRGIIDIRSKAGKGATVTIKLKIYRERSNG